MTPPSIGPRFSSRIAMILTCMGMAVGTGNIWRFPREVANNGGGSFLIPWLVFLFLWSIPLLMVELSVGQHTRKGPFGAFARLAGERFAWMGGFVSICTMLIMVYYAVVTGWTFRYVLYAVDGTLTGLDDQGAIALFDQFRSTSGAWLFFVVAVAVSTLIAWTGARGIERLNKFLIPTLILILIIGAFNSVRLEGAGEGLAYLFTVDWSLLAKPSHWIAGLTQSAWSTGAGWGLMLAYAVYARDQEDPVTTPMATGMGNNGIELIVALMIFPAIFALLQGEAVAYVSGTSWKGGIAFQAVPILFNQMPGGYFLNVLFFVGLASAALTSLVAMVELSTRFFIDFHFSRNTALLITLGMFIVLGSPSALSDAVFDNQDFVWGVGLIISGLFLAFLVFRYGSERFCRDLLDRKGPIKPGLWFRVLIGLCLVEGLVLLVWWFIAAGSATLRYWCLGQWTAVILLLMAFRKPLMARMFPDGLPDS